MTLLDQVADAYRFDGSPDRAADVLAGRYDALTDLTLRAPNGLLVTLGPCGCVQAWRIGRKGRSGPYRLGRRIRACGGEKTMFGAGTCGWLGRPDSIIQVVESEYVALAGRKAVA